MTSGVVNISRRETSKGDEREKMIREKKLIERSCDKVTLALQIQGLSSEARRFLLRFLPSSETVRIQFFQLSGTLHSEFYKIVTSRAIRLQKRRRNAIFPTDPPSTAKSEYQWLFQKGPNAGRLETLNCRLQFPA